MKHQHGGNLTLISEKYGLDPEQIIDFSVNINPMGPPAGVKEVLEDGLSYISIYPEPYCDSLKEKYATRLGVAPGNLIFSNGAVELIYMLLQSIRPRTVLIPGPTFREYEIAARAFQARIKQFPLLPDKGFAPSLKSLIRAARDVDMVFLCNPNNPTGSLFPKELIVQFLDFCQRRGIFVVVDESFLIFHQRGQDLSVIKSVLKSRKLIVLQSLTKFFAIPGLRIGYAAADPRIVNYLSGFQPPWQVNALAQGAALKAMDDLDYAYGTRSFVEQERGLLFTALSAVKGLRVHPSEAPYLLLQLSDGIKAQFVVDQLAEKGLLVRNCANFTFLNEHFLRIAVKNREENFLLAAELTKLLNSGLQK